MSCINLHEKKDLSLDNDIEHISLLSKYATSLENHVKKRYLEIPRLNFRIPRNFGPPHLHVLGGFEDRGITQ